MSGYSANPELRFGLSLPSKGPGTGPDALDAGATIAAKLGWSSVWVTDHLLVPAGEEAGEYGCILEALTALTWVGARYNSLLLGTSVLVPAMRDAPLLAKQIATLDVLTGGRTVIGVGASDNHDDIEYANLGKTERFTRRGAYLDEAIHLWRHLWSGATTPFDGTFHRLSDYSFAPLPPQGAAIPIWCGGRSARAVRRTAELADGYHAAQTGPADLRARIPSIVDAVTALGRPLPTLSVRARVRFDTTNNPVYCLDGTTESMVQDLLEFASLGVTELMLVFESSDPRKLQSQIARFAEDVVAPFRQRAAHGDIR